MVDRQAKRYAADIMTIPANLDGGFGALIGLDMVEFDRAGARSVGRLTVAPEHLNPHHVLHGGVMYSMADQGMGAAVYCVLGEGESCATIEVKIVYLAVVREGVVECESRVINRGKRVIALESDIRNGDRLVAKALGTFAVFPIPAR
ncbi:PaaI family thioesterase [Nocardia sp. SYP-A9097]|uniref:PaaI family thioesterase n=1 Tax=Nocardia sp. SYP-A9097 TaxID=2663237 RepID=UPI0018917634|nr:PaaI family thioesterase [Nocardia sp. SYP-A9097]